MRRAKQCRIRQAVCRRAAVTRAPRSRARLRVVTTRRDSWRSHVHRTRFRRLCNSSNYKLPMQRGRGVRPLVFLLGFQRGYSLPKENIPFVGQSRDARNKLPRKARLYNFPIGDVKHLATEQGPKSIFLATGDEHLPAGDAVQYVFLPPRVKLGQHVVEQ